MNIEQPYESGLHLKLPWPIDTMRTFAVKQIQVLEVGVKRFAPTLDEQGREKPDMTPILWTTEHALEENPFLVAVPETADFRGEGDDSTEKMLRATATSEGETDPASSRGTAVYD